MKAPMERPLSKDFYLRETIDVARDLLGKKLVHILPDGQRLSGMIVETEAYLGIEDPACHSFGNRLTGRTAPLFENGGISYIYLIYGMHHLFNVVTRTAGHPEAVLVRALEPVDGDFFANGPGKVCRALQLSKNQNYLSLLGETLYIAEHKNLLSVDIEDSPRVGIDYAGDAAEWPLRFFIRNHPAVSKTRFPA